MITFRKTMRFPIVRASADTIGSRKARPALHFLVVPVMVVVFAFVHASSAVTSPVPIKPRHLTVLYTSQAYGQIRSCNCTKFRYGGYGREATLVEQARKAEKNLIIIEGGDMIGQARVAQDVLKAQVSFKAIDTMKYAALVPGESEMSAGLDSCQQLAGTSRVPFVLANLPGEDPKIKPYIVCKTPDGLRVGIVGLVDPDLLEKDVVTLTKAKVDDPAEALRRVGPKVRKVADVVVVIAHTTDTEATKLAQSGNADIVICTHSANKIIMPAKGKNSVESPAKMVGKCLLVESGTKWNWNVGRLDVELDKGRVNTFTNNLLFLNRDYTEHPSIVALYDRYNESVKAQALSGAQELRKQVEASLIKRGIDPAKYKRPKTFAGDLACAQCHSAAHDTWSKSRHATAFASLKKTKQEFDPECIGCHTLGANVRGGFVNAQRTPELVNVQCESCHGPGISHAAKPAKGYGQVSEETCRSCHTDDYNPDFDFDQMKQKIAH